MSDDKLLWKPDRKRMEESRLHAFMTDAGRRSGKRFSDYRSLYDWSLAEKEQFWSAVWDFCGVIGSTGERLLLDGDDMERARWFPDARLNFAENLLRPSGVPTALYSAVEGRKAVGLSFERFYDQVGACAAWLRSAGVGKGDRVAGYLPNIPETVVAMLATASLGAIWTSTSPDFGRDSVLERFGQTMPKVVFGVDGYFYNGKHIDTRAKLEAVAAALDSVEHVVLVESTGGPAGGFETVWRRVLDTPHEPTIPFVPCSFNDPLYILYSSGTTGKPKCITHSVGGTLLQHLKEHQLHCDIRPGDKVFYFTTCGWMMWNWLISVLASKAAPVLFDGSPFHPDAGVLWRLAEEVGTTLFGTSAKYLDTLKKQEYEPIRRVNLDTLRTMCSTGSVLAPESFDYVYRSIKQDVCLSSISGGTDIVSCFVLGCPIRPVFRGECQCRGLGMAVEVYDGSGQPQVGVKGELVCTKAFPSQPLYFWGDEDGSKYHDAYFAVYPGVWHHGDYVELTERDTVRMYGRSDATLNPGGVRIGTAEIYRHVEQLEEISESIVIGQEWQDDTRLVLFVVLRPGHRLTEELQRRINATLRENCSPRHMVQKIIEVEEIPRTKSGKIVELAVREVVHGRPVENLSALANPGALEHFRDLDALSR